MEKSEDWQVQPLSASVHADASSNIHALPNLCFTHMCLHYIKQRRWEWIVRQFSWNLYCFDIDFQIKTKDINKKKKNFHLSVFPASTELPLQ